MEGVKNLVVKKHTLPITRIVDALMEMKSVPESEEYRYFDPKTAQSCGLCLQPKQNTLPRRESIRVLSIKFQTIFSNNNKNSNFDPNLK